MPLANPIVHQTQPTPNACTSTCIAMALGIPVADLGVDLERGWPFRYFGPWLAARGIWMRQCIRIEIYGEPMHNGKLYLAAVPSKNMMAGSHAVLVDTRAQATNGNSRSGWKTYDPNRGRDGMKVYDWVDEYYATEFVELVQPLDLDCGLEPPRATP